jgi:hypothetical protein
MPTAEEALLLDLPEGQHVPGYVGWATLTWGALAVSLIGPSGFLLAAVPAGLLIAANVIARRHSRVVR